MTEQSNNPGSIDAQPTANENAAAADDAKSAQTPSEPRAVPQQAGNPTRKLLAGVLGVAVLAVLVVFGIPWGDRPEPGGATVGLAGEPAAAMILGLCPNQMMLQSSDHQLSLHQRQSDGPGRILVNRRAAANLVAADSPPPWSPPSPPALHPVPRLPDQADRSTPRFWTVSVPESLEFRTDRLGVRSDLYLLRRNRTFQRL